MENLVTRARVDCECCEERQLFVSEVARWKKTIHCGCVRSKPIYIVCSMSNRHHPCLQLHRLLERLWSDRIEKVLASVCHWLFTGGILASALLLTVAEFCDPDGQEIPLLIEPAARWIHTHRLALVTYLLIMQCAAGAGAWLTGYFHRRWSFPVDQLTEALNYVVDEHFPSRLPDHVYRATLFRARGNRLVGKWLSLLARSGDVYTSTWTVFAINPNSREKCTGLAGECWFRSMGQTGESFSLELPDCRDSTDKIDEYMTQGHLDPREFSKIQVKSCFFRLVPIKKNGITWGVIVLDTTDAMQSPKMATHNVKTERSQLKSVESAAKMVSLLIS